MLISVSGTKTIREEGNEYKEKDFMGYGTYNQLQMREKVVNVVALQCREYHHYGEVLYLLGWHCVIKS